MEDIINRGGGNLVIRMWNATADDRQADTPVTVSMDGVRVTVPAGGTITLTPGESVTLPQRNYHTFWGEAGKGTVLVGEVSRVNDDHVGNRFRALRVVRGRRASGPRPGAGRSGPLALRVLPPPSLRRQPLPIATAQGLRPCGPSGLSPLPLSQLGFVPKPRADGLRPFYPPTAARRQPHRCATGPRPELLLPINPNPRRPIG
jgi:hypothetical protein